MNGPHHEDEAEPADIVCVIIQGILLVSHVKRIVGQAELTSDLQSEKVEHWAENLSEEDK